MGESKRQQRADARREQLLDVAINLFAQKGYEATSAREVALAAGVTQGLVFHYFGSKEGLLTAVLSSRHSFATELSSVLNEANASSMPVKILLETVCSGWLATLRRETDTTLFLAGLALTNRTFASQLSETIGRTQGAFVSVLESRRDLGEVKEGPDLTVVAHDFLTPIIMFFLLHQASSSWATESTQFIEAHCSFWAQILCV